MLKYGYNFPDGLVDLDVELACMVNRRGSEQGGLGSYRHWKRAVKIMYPDMQVHPWLDTRAENFFEHDYSMWTGCASAGKSHDAVFLGLTWWLGDPTESAVVLTSTTAKSIRRRLWPVLQDLRQRMARVSGSVIAHEGFPGHVLDSKTMVQATKGDDKHAIAAVAVAEGGLTKAVSDIKGFHPKRRLLVIVDEANDTPEAIMASVPNLKKGLREFKLIVIGNAVSRLDTHGRCCEPEMGWNSITVDSEEWKTKGVPEWEIEKGICLHFDGEKSPNVREGTDKYFFLYSNKDLKRAQANEGYEESLWYWSNTRGFWPPDGVCQTVFTDAFVVKHGLRDKVIFMSSVKVIGGLDPSFTSDGDGCVLWFGRLGDLEGGKMCLQMTERKKINLKSGEDIYYQIAERTMAECVKRGMQPEDLGVDTTGGGSGVADILCRIWGPGIHRVGFGEKASDKPASAVDKRLGYEVYTDRVTELWYNAREYGETGQLKGLDMQTCKEFCSRPYTVESKRIQVLPKKECKKQLGHSPDDADAVSVCLDTARKRGLLLSRVQGGLKRLKGWNEKARELNNAVYEEAA